jgi:tRNA 2-thiouridine synthesizing protein C
VAERKTLLVLVRQPPYGSSLARAAVDAALAAAAFDQPVSLLFLDQGVLQLLPDQDTQALGVKNLGKMLSSLPLYDIDRVYVDGVALQRFGLDSGQLAVSAEVLDNQQLQALISAHDHLVSC